MTCRDLPQSRQYEVCDDLGVDYVWQILFVDPAGEPIDISADTIRMTIRDPTTNDLAWELDTDELIVITNGEGGAAEVNFTAAAKDSENIEAGTYSFTVMLDHGGSEQVTHAGTYILGADVNGVTSP